MMDRLTHVDDSGRANMVDVGAKPPQRRTARAEGSISLAPETLRRVRENAMKKGDVLTVAQVAGIQAAKRTAELVPLCHTLSLEKVDVRLSLTETGVAAESEVRCTGKTGVEMEALTAVSVALLTVYDMCKAVDRAMRIGGIRLVEKTKE
ncbi:MAG TPA: cyclic pyranopterin monophosphate synthase MoaC [Phycisphaerae bacterium]|nr:cyclic pyranopterin monophosphate synthase MoaC [Phycisphaerae bacterium]